VEITDADELVRAHQTLVTRHARSIARRWRGHVEMEDLVGVGLFAVLNATRSFDADRKVPLAVHATRAARWAMLSEARTSAIVRRGVVDRKRALLAAESEIEQRHGRVASTAEVAAELGVDVARVDRWRQQSAAIDRVAIVDLEASLSSVDDSLPEDHVLREELLDALRIAIAALPAKLQWVIGATYFDNRPLASVAADLGVSESRVSQLRAEAVALLRDGLRLLLDGDDGGDDAHRDVHGARDAAGRPPRRLRVYRGALRAAAQAS